MYLKRLELTGFKSFAGHTVLEFDPGITAVVGPNGCGKTNIVESIRWVLGEQSAKSLRGKKMEDIIFHGTQDRHGTGMAEVSLTFDNSEKALPIEFNEVTVTRRIFRSGESRYFINKNPCRLRDVENIFADTGIGMRAYSVFEQGKMDLILSSKPSERRFVFEEAAGISKYKDRKKETLHKIEITEANLIRLNDIIKEIKRQLNSIERQAAKARRYKKIKEELNTKERIMLCCELRRSEGKLDGLIRGKNAAEDTAEKARGQVCLKETELARMRDDLRRINVELSDIARKRIALETRITEKRKDIQFKKNRVDELARRDIDICAEAEEADNNIASLNNVLCGLIKDAENLLEEKNACKENLREKYNEVKDLEKKCTRTAADIKTKRETLVDWYAGEARIKNDFLNIDARLRDIQLKERRHSVDLNKMKGEKGRLAEELAKMGNVISSHRKSLFDVRQTIKNREENLILLEEEVSNINSVLAEKQRFFAEKRAEYELLSAQKKQLAGYAEGTAAVIEHKEDFPGIRGVVSSLLTVPKEYVGAVSSALGEKAQWLVADTLENARRAAGILRGQNISNAVFIIMEMLPDEEDRHIDYKYGVRASDVVTCAKGYERLARFLLGRVYILDSLSSFSPPPDCRCGSFAAVSGDGLVIDMRGILSLGMHMDDPVNLIARDMHINELKEMLNNISSEILALTEKYNAIRERFLREEREIEGAKNNLYNEEISFSVQENDFMKCRDAYNSAVEGINMLEAEGEDISVQKKELMQRRAEKEEDMKQKMDKGKVFDEEIRSIEASLSALHEKRQIKEREYTELKISLVSYEEKENLLEFKKEEAQKEKAAKEDAAARLFAEKEKNAEYAEILKSEIAVLENDIQKISGGAADSADESELLIKKREELEGRIKECEDALRALRQDADSRFSAVNEKNLLVSEAHLEIKNIIKKLESGYKTSYDNAKNISVEGVKAEVLEEEIVAARSRIEAMGEVSLLAIEEQDDLARRYDFLNGQRQDLINSKESLLRTIAKLNSTTKKMFWDTFMQIRGNFNGIFARLFGGGKADLVLIDETDILESGIEIIARPPGKRLQNISLLSGGEKTLTAIALLFSIFKVKPSPFCIMDEIDAPLDDSNINRFIEILKEFSAASQFVVATHNKRTISAARSLYGVTMQETGVSRIVSVKFEGSVR